MIADRSHPSLGLISTIGELTILFAALLYVAGWSYLYQYYKTFGVRLSALNLPIYDALVYSLTTIFSGFRSVFVCLLLIVMISAIFSIDRLNEPPFKYFRISLFLVLVLALGFWLSHEGVRLGAAQAQKDMRETETSLPNVRLRMKTEPEAGTAGTGDEEFDQPGYRLLIHAKGQYYLFRPIKDVSGLPASNIDLYVVPDSRVRSIHIQRGISF